MRAVNELLPVGAGSKYDKTNVSVSSDRIVLLSSGKRLNLQGRVVFILASFSFLFFLLVHHVSQLSSIIPQIPIAD